MLKFILSLLYIGSSLSCNKPEINVLKIIVSQYIHREQVFPLKAEPWLKVGTYFELHITLCGNSVVFIVKKMIFLYKGF